MMLKASIIMGIFLLLWSTALAAKPYGATLCAEDPDYSCYKVKKGETWEKLFPDINTRDLIKRINRTNLRLHSGMTIAIPENLSDDVNMLDYAPFNQQIDSPGKKVIIVSLDRLAFAAYDPDGMLVYWGPISGGKGFCPDTGKRCRSPIGNFAIYNKGGAGCVSTKYPVGRGGAPMPYCMFFHGGFALHGSYEVPGYHASHGCIRLFVDDAEWLNQEFTYDSRALVYVVKD